MILNNFQPIRNYCSSGKEVKGKNGAVNDPKNRSNDPENPIEKTSTESDIEKKLEAIDRKYPNDMSYQAGIEATNMKIKLVTRETGLGFRTAIDDIEELVYPDWMFDTPLNRKQRLILSHVIGSYKIWTFVEGKNEKLF